MNDWHRVVDDGVRVYQSGPYRVWKDDDRHYGTWAASIEGLDGQEVILGHQQTKRAAKGLCTEHGRNA